MRDAWVALCKVCWEELSLIIKVRPGLLLRPHGPQEGDATKLQLWVAILNAPTCSDLFPILYKCWI